VSTHSRKNRAQKGAGQTQGTHTKYIYTARTHTHDRIRSVCRGWLPAREREKGHGVAYRRWNVSRPGHIASGRITMYSCAATQGARVSRRTHNPTLPLHEEDGDMHCAAQPFDSQGKVIPSLRRSPFMHKARTCAKFRSRFSESGSLGLYISMVSWPKGTPARMAVRTSTMAVREQHPPPAQTITWRRCSTHAQQ
jgi:hypothetical protein